MVNISAVSVILIMPTFEYKAINQAGEEITEVMDAVDENAIADRLSSLGYLPITIKPKGTSSGFLPFSFGGKLKQVEIIVFTKQLVTLLKAGVPLLACLEALSDQAENQTVKKVIEEIYIDIQSGASFSDALQNHPKDFSELYVNSVRAGEMGGALDDVLERIVLLMEHDQETRSRVKAALRYPVMIVVSLIIAFIALMMLVVPKFIDLFEKLGVDLPLPTRILIGIYTVVHDYWYVLLIGLVLTTVGFIKYIRTEKGAYQWDKLKISTPIFGQLVMKTAMSRFTRMFETLNSSGLPILRTLEISSKTVGNIVVGKVIQDAVGGILEGEGIAGPLSRSQIFPPMVVKMISIGEKSGSLDEMLVNISRHYDSEVDYAVKGLTSMIEPIMTVGVGLIVLFLALAIFLPMWNLTKLAQ
ncbi:MAG: type II secretion system F family protein [bacterium]